MLTLADIDAKFPETHNGSVFSDLHKAAYGYRPRGITFKDLADFEETWNRTRIHAEEAQEMNDQFEAIALERLIQQMNEIRLVMPTATNADIIRYIDDANETDRDLEYLDYKLGVKYGTCKRLAEETE